MQAKSLYSLHRGDPHPPVPPRNVLQNATRLLGDIASQRGRHDCQPAHCGLCSGGFQRNLLEALLLLHGDSWVLAPFPLMKELDLPNASAFGGLVRSNYTATSAFFAFAKAITECM